MTHFTDTEADRLLDELVGKPMPEPEPPTALVIDDDVTCATALASMLQGAEFRTRFALSGQEGLDLFRVRQADLVICDVQMSGMSGLHVMRSLRAMAPTRRVEIVAYTVDADSITDAFQSGASDVYIKGDAHHDQVIQAKCRALRHRLALEKLSELEMQRQKIALVSLAHHVRAMKQTLEPVHDLADAITKLGQLIELLAWAGAPIVWTLKKARAVWKELVFIGLLVGGTYTYLKTGQWPKG